MELILVRHGRPEHIELAEGPADPSLTDVGHRQARAVGSWLAAEPLDVLYSSPMARARETADPLARILDVEPVIREGVREFDAEDRSYVPLEVIRQDKANWKAYLDREDSTDRTAFTAEVVESLETIIADHPGETAVVVCHGGVINVWACHVLGVPTRLFFNPDYTSVNRFLAASSGERSIVSLNETSHLRGAPDLSL